MDIEISRTSQRRRSSMLGEPDLDRGREEHRRVAVTPCPPVPFMAAGQASADDLAEERPPHRTALAMAVAAIAIVVLGAFLVTGGLGAKAGSPENALPGSAEVARVTAPNAPSDRVHLGSPVGSDRASGHDKHGPEGSGHGGKDHPTSADPPPGGGDGGGGGEESKPLATVDPPVVGKVTVDEPELPPLPDVDGSVPDLPVPDVDLP
jgi:hypothetical protein